MDLMKSVELSGLPVKDIIINPRRYLDNPEVIGTVLDGLKELGRQLTEHRARLQGVLLHEMQDNEATKMKIIGFDGNEKDVTVKNGSYKLQYKSDEAERLIRNRGFDPTMFGSYEFKVKSWKELKELRKRGYKYKDLVDDLYKEDKKSLEIK